MRPHRYAFLTQAAKQNNRRTPGWTADDAASLFLVFRSCCSSPFPFLNVQLLRVTVSSSRTVCIYEKILRQNPNIGPALTFSQTSLITPKSLPHFIEWRKSRNGFLLPVLK